MIWAAPCRPLLSLQDISLTFGTAPLLAGAALAVGAGDRVCLVGRNGSRQIHPAAHRRRPDRSPMPAAASPSPAPPSAICRRNRTCPGSPPRCAYVEAGLDPDAAEADHHRARYLLEQLGLTGDEDPATLSGGEARRAALARVLAPSPDILLLDEPTNHLDLPGIEWLERELAGLRSGIVLISHDRRLLERLSRATVWLDRGITRTLDRGFRGFRSLARRGAGAGGDRPPQARPQDRDGGGLAALRRHRPAQAQPEAARRPARAARSAAASSAPPPGKVRLEAARRELSGRLVVVAEGVVEVLMATARSCGIFRPASCAATGSASSAPNGAGKTTLLNLLTGALAPDAGEVRLGTNLAQVTLDQRRETLDPTQTLRQTLTGGAGDTVTVGGQTRHVVGYMKDFLFGPEQANTPVGVLSGGERGRLTLARAFARPSNLLVLDEPTNDLDLETLELLQERLAEYAGTVLLVSHDRDFLDRVVTSVIAAEGDGRWIEYAGGYTDMLAQRGPAAAAPAATSTPKSRPALPPRQGARTRRMSFKDRHALQTLPAQIEGLHAEIARLGTVLADGSLYVRDPARFAATAAALTAAQAALAAAEEQWLALEIQRETLEG